MQDQNQNWYKNEQLYRVKEYAFVSALILMCVCSLQPDSIFLLKELEGKVLEEVKHLIEINSKASAHSKHPLAVF